MKSIFTLLCASLISGAAIAQIPNANFESWDSFTGYVSPTSWDNLNSSTSALSVYTCEQGSPGYTGAHYLKLTSKTVIGLGVAPGVAVSGLIDFTTYGPKSGFPTTARPVSLKGMWQYMASGADQGFISVLLSRWNTATSRRDTVAFANNPLVGMAMSWASFNINLNYYSGYAPDSAIIVLSASGATAVNGSYLYVDSLTFSGSVPLGVTTIGASKLAPTTLYPNPASSQVAISYYSPNAHNVNITLEDMSGKTIKTLDFAAIKGENNINLNVADIARGLYFVRIVNEANTEVKKLIVE